MPLRLKQLDGAAASQVVRFLEDCRSFDGASAAVQMDHGLNADQDAFSWFLCFREDRLAGLCSVFAPSAVEAELSLCVRPDLRRMGLGTSLLEDAAAHLRERGVLRFLLVCDRESSPGRAFAAVRSSGLDHSEYSLRLAAPAAVPPLAPRLAIRAAEAGDVETLSLICADAFQDDPDSARSFIVHSMSVPHRRLYLGSIPGPDGSWRPVCCCALAAEGKDLSVNTVAVAGAFQGQGYAKEFLSRILAAEATGAENVTIDVDSGNPKAYGLYRSLGFVESRTIDYYLACPFP